MATKRNGTDAPASHSTHNGTRVSVDRDEYDALNSLRDLYDKAVAEKAALANSNHDIRLICEAQSRRLTEADLLVQNYERVNGLQRVFIDMLRADRPLTSTLEELSLFWKHWTTTTENHLVRNPGQRAEAAKLEPDLFRSWRLWVRDSGKASRTFSLAGTRAEVEALNAIPQATLQEHILDQAKAQNIAQAGRIRELEAELAAYRSAVKTRDGGERTK